MPASALTLPSPRPPHHPAPHHPAARALPGRALLAAAILAVALPLALHPAAARAADDAATITVTGEGVVQTAPDMATLQLGTTTEGETAAAALAANSAAVAKVLASLAAAGIAPRDVQTSGLALNPQWSNYTGSEEVNRITGYVATNGVTVRIRALDGLGAVLDAAVSDGANTFNGLTFDLQDPQPSQDAARARATADALRRARIIADAAGVRLGDIRSVTEQPGYGPPVPMFRAEAASDAGAVPVAGGELGVTASVTLVIGIDD